MKRALHSAPNHSLKCSHTNAFACPPTSTQRKPSLCSPSSPPLSFPSSFRKKLSTFLQHPDWKNASNYVAKCYMKEEARECYFEDVRVQMDAKLWGEEYTKKNPPKKASPMPAPPTPAPSHISASCVCAVLCCAMTEVGPHPYMSRTTPMHEQDHTHT